jgi:hypothetical protein
MANGVGVFSLPKPEVHGGDQLTGDISLPMLVVLGSGGASVVSALILPIPRVLGGESITVRQLSALLSLTAPTISSTGTAPIVMYGRIVLPTPRINVGVLSGGISGRGSFILPRFVVSRIAPFHAIGVWGATSAEIFGLGRISISDYKAVVMNLSNQAITTYDNFDFNSMAYFNGTYLGASSAGIYKLSGNLDNTSTIKSRIKTGSIDFGSGFIKHLRDIWLTYRTDGTVAVVLWVDEDDNSQVELRSKKSSKKMQEEKFTAPLGLKGRFYTIEFKNIGGADFDINSISMIVEEIKRKIR